MMLKELTINEFEMFKRNYNISSVYQSAAYMSVMSQENFETVLLGLIDNNNILAASLILIDKNKKLRRAFAPKGFLIDYNNLNLLSYFTNEVKKYLSKKNVMSLKISPPITKVITDFKYNIFNYNNYYDNMLFNLNKVGFKHLGYNNYFEALKPRFEAILDITTPYYILFKNIKKEFRTKIRSAEANGIKIYKGNEKDLEYLYNQIKLKYPRKFEYFLHTYNEFNKYKNIDLYFAKLDTQHYLDYLQKELIKQENECAHFNTLISSNNEKNEQNLARKMRADQELNRIRKQLVKATRYLKDNPNGIIISTALVIKDNEEAYLLVDGYDKKYKYLNAKHLLIWKLIENYSNQGYRILNLGGITNPNLKNNQYQGLNDFKLNFNTLCYEYIGDLEITCNDTLAFLSKTPLKSILKI